jgi:hypothetical protein
MLMPRIFATSPSVTAMLMPTRLRSSGVTGGLDLRAVHPARQVLALDLLLGGLEHRAVEDAPLGEAVFAQHLAHRVGLEFLHPGEVDLGHCRALLHEHHQHVVLVLQAHVGEEAGGVKRPQRRARRSSFMTSPTLIGR